MSSPDDSQFRRRSDVQDAAEAQAVRILAVDDDPAYLRFLSLVLGRAGFTIETAPDGASALERITASPRIDLLLIDLAMPGMDGIETVRRIQVETPATGLYTVLLTASTSMEVKLRALDGGLDDFLTKMSTESEIVAKVRSAARRLAVEQRLHLQNVELQTLALTDELTRIPNRRAVVRAGQQILDDSRQLSVILFDLERFKYINDTYGHLAGDRVLREVGAKLQEETRYGDLIGRYGGDEFLLLLPDTSPEGARQISERIVARIRQPIWSIAIEPVSVGAQCGVATAPEDGTTLDSLIALCDQRLYRSKSALQGSRRSREERQNAQ